jgi:hypothetical protein
VHSPVPAGRPGAQSGKVLIHRPPGIGFVDRAAWQRSAEPGQDKNIGTVQNDTFQITEHGRSDRPAAHLLRIRPAHGAAGEAQTGATATLGAG